MLGGGDVCVIIGSGECSLDVGGCLVYEADGGRPCGGGDAVPSAGGRAGDISDEVVGFGAGGELGCSCGPGGIGGSGISSCGGGE